MRIITSEAVCVFPRLHGYVYIYVRIFSYVYTYVSIWLIIYMYIYVCIFYIYKYIDIFMYKYIYLYFFLKPVCAPPFILPPLTRTWSDVGFILLIRFLVWLCLNILKNKTGAVFKYVSKSQIYVYTPQSSNFVWSNVHKHILISYIIYSLLF